MVETFTPAVCGSRPRQRLALVLFALAAVAASAALGAALGFVGGFLGTRPALIAAAASPFSPRSGSRAPSRFPFRSPASRCPSAGSTSCRSQSGARATAPGSAWASSPSSLSRRSGWRAPRRSRWGGRSSLRPVALYGAGRAFMTVWPRRREPDGAAAESLVGRSRLVGRANVVVLGLAVVLAVAPAAGAAVTSLGRGFDPAAYGTTLARAYGRGHDQGPRRAARSGPDGPHQPRRCACARRRLPRLPGRRGHQGDRLAHGHARPQARRAVLTPRSTGRSSAISETTEPTSA